MSGAATTVTYSDIAGGWSGAGGTGNIDADPLFVTHLSGMWSEMSFAMYEPATGQTTFYELAQVWNAGELVGKFLNPDTTQPLQALIVTNTTWTITVWGDFELSRHFVGLAYQIYGNLFYQNSTEALFQGEGLRWRSARKSMRIGGSDGRPWR